MYLLPCPSCQKPVKVSPSQAGNEISCNHCSDRIAIPKLGELRQLPRDDDFDGSTRRNSASSDEGAGARIGFVIFGLLSVFMLMIALFCGIRWASSPASETTESHIAKIAEQFPKLEPANLIQEFEDMENRALDFPVAFGYHRDLMEKHAWRNKTLLSGGVALGCGILAMVLASFSGGRKA